MQRLRIQKEEANNLMGPLEEKRAWRVTARKKLSLSRTILDKYLIDSKESAAGVLG